MGRRTSPRVDTKQYRTSVLIVCEGKNTEPIYFQTLIKALRLDVTIEVKVVGDTPHTDPAGLLEDALKLRDLRRKEAKKSNVLRPYDEIWLVFDTEWPGKHANLAQSTNKVRESHFQSAISNPSFEVWFLLHEKRTPPGCSCYQDAEKVLKTLHKDLTHYGKSRDATLQCVNWSMMEGRLPRALQNGHAQPKESFCPTVLDLPTATATTVHRLVQLLVEACDDQPTLNRLGIRKGKPE